jgi:ABC-type multidrug transport system fused ATPase/permease subunit
MRTVFRTWGLIKPYWKRLMITYVSLLIGISLDLLLPWILRQTIDIGVTGGQPRFMFTAGALVLGIGVLKAGASAGQRYYSEWLSSLICATGSTGTSSTCPFPFTTGPRPGSS